MCTPARTLMCHCSSFQPGEIRSKGNAVPLQLFGLYMDWFLVCPHCSQQQFLQEIENAVRVMKIGVEVFKIIVCFVSHSFFLKLFKSTAGPKELRL